MRYIYRWIGPATHQFMRYGGVARYAIRKNAGENINGKPEAETQEPRRASPPPASSLCYEHSPLEPHPSHIYPSVSHKGNTNVLNMQDIQRKTIGLVAQSMLSSMIFTYLPHQSPRNDAVTFYLSPIDFLGNITTSSASAILHALTIRRYMHCKG